jgi:hypothetical protein
MTGQLDIQVSLRAFAESVIGGSGGCPFPRIRTTGKPDYYLYRDCLSLYALYTGLTKEQDPRP